MWTQTISTAFSTKVQNVQKTGNGDRQRGILLPPPKIEQQVRRIIEEFRAGTLDKVPVWMDKNGRTMLVTYMAVRDKSGKYLGTMELVQDMEFAKEYFQK